MFRMPEIQRTGDGLPHNFSWVLKDTLGKIQIKITLNYHIICFGGRRYIYVNIDHTIYI